MKRLFRFVYALPLILFSPLMILIAALVLAATDLLAAVWKKKDLPPSVLPSKRAASIVIPTWNGRELVQRFLPSVVAAAAHNPGNEIILVDNASKDGTTSWVRENFPQVKVLEMASNLGFGGGANAGILAARNDIVVLLNNDMRVEEGFLQPLIDGFTDENVFSVSCQIFFPDPSKRREETGLSQGAWRDGMLRVGHRIDDGINDLYPCFYGGGGSTAYDRRKFLQLGGFDSLLSPFYLEDTDLGYMAWKRGWKVLYQPRSIVYHEHRGTIGRSFTPDQIQAILEKNYILWAWKNIHDWRLFAQHLLYAQAGAWLSALAGETVERASLRGIWGAFRRLPAAACSRWRARQLAAISDAEAFSRPMGGYFRDRFEPIPVRPKPLRVLFVAPYPILPPIHGGGVFMYQTLAELAKRCELHLIVLLHYQHELAANEPLRKICASVEFLMKAPGSPRASASILPRAVREFAIEDLAWLIHRQILKHSIDVVQLEYTPLAQYAGDFRRLVCALFEHDVYFQSIARSWPYLIGAVAKAKAAIEYLRALYFETRVLRKLDLVETCSQENLSYLLSYLPELRKKAAAGLRAGLNVSQYPFQVDNREPGTLLFVGSFRHQPNQSALNWFASEVFPLILKQRPDARLVVVGSDPPPPHVLPSLERIELLGSVGDIREPLSRFAVFICPVLSGSGVRVKLLEAFACGIPVVSTSLGAEGLGVRNGETCLLADAPARFAAAVLRLLDDPALGKQLALAARRHVEQNWDIVSATERLLQSYHTALEKKRGAPN